MSEKLTPYVTNELKDAGKELDRALSILEGVGGTDVTKWAQSNGLAMGCVDSALDIINAIVAVNGAKEKV